LRQENALFNLRPSKGMGELDHNNFRIADQLGTHHSSGILCGRNDLAAKRVPNERGIYTFATLADKGFTGSVCFVGFQVLR
jgi:hypothetical protein